MDQPAGLQVDYIFRGVEHAVRVVVSGQVLELEVEDRMTADQWRGEFDANCECVCRGWPPLPPKAEAEPSCVCSCLFLSSSRWDRSVDPIDVARGNRGWAELENLSILPLCWASGQTSGGTFLSTQSLKT